MSEFVLAFGVFQLWMYGFVTAIFSLSFWWGYALSLIVIASMLFPADHANDDPVTLLVLFVWWTFTFPFGATVGLFAAAKFRFMQLIDVRALDHKSQWTRTTVGTLLFSWSWVIFYAGINFVLLRFSETGMSPIGGISDSTSIGVGIFLLIVFAAIVVTVTVVMAMGGALSKRNIKYIWLMAFVVWTGVVHDSLAGDLDRPGPGGIMLLVLILLILLEIPLFYYIPSSKLDPYYHNWRNTLIFVTVFGILLVLAQITGWITNNASQGSHIAVFIAIVVYSVVAVIAIYIASAFISLEEKPRTEKTGKPLNKKKKTAKQVLSIF